MIVVDASVVAKWFLPEAASDAAQRLLERDELRLHGPDLLLVEVSGAIVRHVNARTLSRSRGEDALREWTSGWRAGRIEAHRLSADLLSDAASIAIELGHPLKDCVYLALAVDLGCRLLTADAKFRDAAAVRYPVVDLLA